VSEKSLANVALIKRHTTPQIGVLRVTASLLSGRGVTCVSSEPSKVLGRVILHVTMPHSLSFLPALMKMLLSAPSLTIYSSNFYITNITQEIKHLN
jgi:hypothetical protein